MQSAIGVVELSSIAKGIAISDDMVKSASVNLLMAKTICPGKYLIMVGGDVAAINQAMEVGRNRAGHLLIDSFILTNLHPDVLPAISNTTVIEQCQALGIVETYSVAACIESADRAAKAANVVLVQIHMAYGIGGKCYVVMSGDVADIETAVQHATEQAHTHGSLVANAVIPNPHKAVWQQLIGG